MKVFRKKTIIKSSLPVNYINKTIDLAIGQSKITSLYSTVESENESHLSALESDTEADLQSAHDVWSKKSIVKCVKKTKKKTIGHYQKPMQTFKEITYKTMN